MTIKVNVVNTVYPAVIYVSIVIHGKLFKIKRHSYSNRFWLDILNYLQTVSTKHINKSHI